jgi:hypothetical protein
MSENDNKVQSVQEKSNSTKKAESDCSFELSSDEENKKQSAKPKVESKLNVEEEDKYLKQLQIENEMLQHQINSVIGSAQPENDPPMPSTQIAVPEAAPSSAPLLTPPLSNSKKERSSGSAKKEHSSQFSPSNGKETPEYKPIPYNDKVKSLEGKICDSTKAIKRLEKLIKDREDTIKSQAAEIEKKTKLLDHLESKKENTTSMQKNAQLQQNLGESIRQKESVQEEKLRQQETTIANIKSQIAKAQQNNSMLMDKLKKSNEMHEKLEKENKAIKSKQVDDEALRGKYVVELEKLKMLSKQYSSKEEYLKGEMDTICSKYNELHGSIMKLMNCSKNVIDMHSRVNSILAKQQN